MSTSAANRECLERIQRGTASLADVRPAADVIPGLTGRTVLHAGPPVSWDAMCGPMRGAVIGACLFEGWAHTPADALALAAGGGIAFDSCHHHRAVGPMAGVLTRSMAVFVVKNDAYGSEAYATINEGLGRVLRYGANDAAVIERLRFINGELAPVVAEAIRRIGGIDVKSLIAQSLAMGDEAHNRCKAGTGLLIRTLGPHLAALGSAMLPQALAFIGASDSFFLNLAMPACKAMLDAAHGIAGSTVVTAMARNGTEFGIRVSGAGNRWFTAAAPKIDGLYFPGYGAADANPDMGDSAITETAGLGAFAMAAAPAIVQFVGGTPQRATETTELMYEITLGEHEAFKIPALDFRGTPIGIDVRKVVATGITPAINTGIAHREAGIGQIGAGLTSAPMECFVNALDALASA
jgi:hypothetical protein